MSDPFKPTSLQALEPTLTEFFKPLYAILDQVKPLTSRGNRPLQLEFKHELNALIYFHLELFECAADLVQNMNEDDFALTHITPPKGIQKSSFGEAINSRGLPQMMEVFAKLQSQVAADPSNSHYDLGDIRIIDGSFIEATLSMEWADYRKTSKKAKIHLGLCLDSIPRKLFLTNGKANEKSFVDQILEPGQTGITDRGYQCHKQFDQWQKNGRHLICRIKDNTTVTEIEVYQLPDDQPQIYYDAKVQLGTEGINQTEEPLRLIKYEIDRVDYWIVTSRFDLTAEQIARAYRIRWYIEVFFKWWKKHLNVYHLIARSEYGLQVQILAGLITYLLLVIYFRNNRQTVSIKNVRTIRHTIKNEFGDAKAKKIVEQTHVSWFLLGLCIAYFLAKT